jgi:dTDP-4-dehydrorhamnose 3,5-epimerase
MRYNSLTETNEHVHDVVVRVLDPHLDERGSLTEVLRSDWLELFNPTTSGFAQCYYSLTKPGVARDEDRWHVHQYQKDRFVIVDGVAALALYDPRPHSPTRGLLNVFRIYGAKYLEGQSVVLVPEGVLHSFLALGAGSCILLNLPTRLYDGSDEGRVPFTEAKVLFEDGIPFSWKAVRDFENQRFDHR